jgi:hypothetical protein
MNTATFQNASSPERYYTIISVPRIEAKAFQHAEVHPTNEVHVWSQDHFLPPSGSDVQHQQYSAGPGRSLD